MNHTGNHVLGDEMLDNIAMHLDIIKLDIKVLNIFFYNVAVLAFNNFIILGLLFDEASSLSFSINICHIAIHLAMGVGISLRRLIKFSIP
ncbi:hypothetical protein AcW1_005442 [Taiwanofungus camphoratus]|nr:hypothetical protein AcV7_009247 [Antrodia cinnamomea]KAI0956863.1 hypothetical protein AcW1_005442 [Antrodia cinnamomea]